MTKETSTHNDDSMFFPQKLMVILADPSNQHAISWLPNGHAFVIHNRDVFAESVMPKYFSRQAKYSSFTRKLNRWNFQRIAKGPECGAYHHHFFLRDKPQLAAQMYCKNARTILAMASSNEPKKAHSDEVEITVASTSTNQDKASVGKVAPQPSNDSNDLKSLVSSTLSSFIQSRNAHASHLNPTSQRVPLPLLDLKMLPATRSSATQYQGQDSTANLLLVQDMMLQRQKERQQYEQEVAAMRLHQMQQASAQEELMQNVRMQYMVEMSLQELRKQDQMQYHHMLSTVPVAVKPQSPSNKNSTPPNGTKRSPAA